MKVLVILSLFLGMISCSFSKQQIKENDRANKMINGMEFAHLKLKNELEILLVHDARFKNSSAAMAVGVGSLEDPIDAQGMAHYLEHMLFLGTKEFPKPDEYSTYMETHGGWDNAYTSDDVTNYMLEVDNTAIEGALQRFSRFFVNPLFDATYVDREKNAVNSEFEKNIKQDGWREDRYINTLAKEGHAYQKFSTGNTNTLQKVSREKVIAFYQKYYTSNNMKLVVMSSVPMEQLRGFAEKYFSDIPNRHVTAPKYEDMYFDFLQKERIHFIKSINDIDEMAILFNIPDETPYWRTKPVHMIAKLLGDEGQGSLLSHLKEQGLALELSASTSFWRTFTLQISLTPKGRKNYLQVLAAVNQSLRLLQTNLYPEYLFKDEKSLSRIGLDNLEPSSSGQRAAGFARNLLEYPGADFLEKKYLIKDYSLEDFKHFLSFIDLSKAHILVLSKNEKTQKKESIFGVEYSRSVVPEIPNINIQTLAYPAANKYVPTDFQLVTQQKIREDGIQKTLPQGDQLFIKTDTDLGLAKASWKLSIYGNVDPSPQNFALLSLYVMCKDEEMREWAYPISEAGAHFQMSIGSQPDELLLTVAGYSQRLETILQDAIKNDERHQRLNDVVINEKVFSNIKDRFKKDLKNYEEAVPNQRLLTEAATVSFKNAVHWKATLKALQNLQLKDVQAFAKKFFSQVSIRTVVYGNVRADSVEKQIVHVREALQAQPLSTNQIRTKRVEFRIIPEGKTYSMPVTGKNNNHAVFALYRWLPWSVENHAKILVVGQLLSQPYFAELRTRQQLGYVARAGGVHQNGYVGISALLQSPKVESLVLQKKSNDFLKSFFEKTASSLTDKELQPILAAIVNELVTTPNTLVEREAEFYQASVKYGGRFTIRQEIADEVKKLNAEKMKKFISQSFIKQKPGLLAFYYFGSGTQLNKTKIPGQIFDIPEELKWEIVNPYLK